MKREYSAPIAELFAAELEGIIAVSKPYFDVETDPDVPPPGAEAKSNAYNPIFDFGD